MSIQMLETPRVIVQASRAYMLTGEGLLSVPREPDHGQPRLRTTVLQTGSCIQSSRTIELSTLLEVLATGSHGLRAPRRIACVVICCLRRFLQRNTITTTTSITTTNTDYYYYYYHYHDHYRYYHFTAIIQDNLCQPAPAVQELEDFAGTEFYSPQAFADGNQHIRIRETTRTVLLSGVTCTVSVPSTTTITTTTSFSVSVNELSLQESFQAWLGS